MVKDMKKLRDSDPVDLSLYQQLIGSLMYLENTQSDIFFVVRLSYDIQLHGFRWAGSADDRRSVTWICFSLIFATMSWASRKQKFVALSTAEAEYIAAYDACTEAMWLYKLVYGLFDQVLDSTVIYFDNHICVKLSEKPMFHDKLKHIDIEYYFLHDRLQRGEVVLQYIFTNEHITYILVKPLSNMTSLLEKEEINSRLGWSIDIYLFMGTYFPVQKMVQVGQSPSSPESGPRFMADKHFPVRKMVKIG
jgi:hypothetical protein